MVNDIKIKKYWILTFCMIFCSSVTFAQDLSDQEMGFDVARVTTSLKEHGVKDQNLAREIAMMREMQRTQYIEMKKSEEAVLKKIRSEQNAKSNTSKSSAVTDIPQSEKDALKALYDSTGGANWLQKQGWDFSKPVTSWNSQFNTGWYGVTVTNGFVTSLELTFNGLTGNIPADIGAFSQLTKLDLSFNKLTGSIPDEIGKFSQLYWLNLASNNLSGSIPSEIGQLSQLTYLDIQRNKEISGVIPSQIGQLTKLIWLRLLNNKLTGAIPSEIGQLLQLKELDLSFNSLNGVIPKQVGLLSKLENLDLQINQFTGNIPTEIYNLTNLKRLTLANNQLGGVMSAQIGQLVNLNSLNLMNNKFEGSLPSEVTQLTKLVGIFIQNNKFTGTIPSLTNLIDFKDLNIYNNSFRFIDFVTDYSSYKTKLRYFFYSPQLKTDVEKIISLSIGSDITLKMYDDNRFVPDEIFQWYKGLSPNGVLIPGATSREYTITNLKESDAGDYYCLSKHPQITNPDPTVNYQNLILERFPIHLSVSNCTPKTGTLKIPTEQIAVGKTAKFSFEETKETVISGEAVKYKWTITNTAGETVNSITTTVGVHSFVFATEGKYTVNLIVTGADNCEAAFNQEVTIVPEVQCLNENISFSFETTAPNLSYVWTATNVAGVVVNSSTASPSSLYNVSFATPGNYKITMVATDTVTQCFETFTKNVTIESCAPTNCMVHFNFNFKIPDTGQGFGGLVLDLGSRMNIANGVVDFLKANSNKKLFATTFDMTNKGVNAVMVNKEITVNPGDVYKVGTANEISNSTPTVIRIQDNSYSNTFSTLINSGILKNTALKNDGIDVSFFIISEDNNTSSLDGARNAYQALLSSGKAKKVFFVFVNEGKFSYIKQQGLIRRKVTITPTQYLAEIMGSTPINYAETNSILNSDFVQFSKAEIANVGFKKVFNDFLQKGYNDVSTKCEDVESCTKKNLYTPEIKRLFLNLANKLKSIPAGNDANTYAQKELAALAPYTIDLKPIIYNFINTNSTISFSFTETSLENDVQLPQLASGSIVDIDLSQYTDIATKTPVNTVFNDGKIDLTNGFVRNIDFCVKELSCVSHVALVLDESGSIDLKEMNKIKKQLKGFVYQQALTNEKIGSNIHISLTGMSDSDDPTKRRTDFILPIKASTDPSVLGKFYTWIDDLGFRNGQTGISAGSDYWYSGLDQALKYELKPDVVIMITDGCQTDNAGNLQTKMMSFNNAKGSSSDLPHLYVVGIENGFYVDKPSTGKIADRNEDPNYNTGLQKRSLTAKVAARLTKSLQYLLGFTETEFPVSSISDFKTATYFGHDNFNLLALDETYISDKLADSDIVCGDSAVKDFCDDCFSFKPEPDHEYLLSAWVKEESFVQVKSYMNSSINIVFYRQKEALDIPGQIIATEIAVPSGEIIDGWQRIVKKIKVPSNAITIGFTLENKSASIPVYFDDIRIHPLKGSVKSFVYDPETFKLMSELDENNYSTFYEYDNEGGLVRVKKETSKGIKTIQETRSGNFINTKE